MNRSARLCRSWSETVLASGWFSLAKSWQRSRGETGADDGTMQVRREIPDAVAPRDRVGTGRRDEPQAGQRPSPVSYLDGGRANGGGNLNATLRAVLAVYWRTNAGIPAFADP